MSSLENKYICFCVIYIYLHTPKHMPFVFKYGTRKLYNQAFYLLFTFVCYCWRLPTWHVQKVGSGKTSLQQRDQLICCYMNRSDWYQLEQCQWNYWRENEFIKYYIRKYRIQSLVFFKIFQVIPICNSFWESLITIRFRVLGIAKLRLTPMFLACLCKWWCHLWLKTC